MADPWQAGMKRALDVFGAVVGLAVCAPLLAVFAVCIRAESPGPIFFSQARLGRGARPFQCYKLRTMRRDAEARLHADAALRAEYEANSFKLPCDVDDRITMVGRALRLSSLDELPQLWNVLRGDMSLVGPRPILDRELANYAVADRPTLLAVRPGVTGAWAVAGRSRIGYPQRSAIELAYVREWSITKDLAILFRTFGAVLARRGAS